MCLKMLVLVMFIGIAALQMQSSNAQRTHVVGGTDGTWSVPQTTSFYRTWAASRTFAAGDILVFNFATGYHTVAQVTETAFDSCTTTNPIDAWTTGPLELELLTTGNYHFICQFPGHCSYGQKFALTITSPARSPPAPATPARSPPPPATPALSPPPPASPALSPPPPASPALSPPPPASPALSPPPPASPAFSPPPPASPALSPPPPAGSISPPPPGDGISPPPPVVIVDPFPTSASSYIAAALPVTFMSVAVALFY